MRFVNLFSDHWHNKQQKIMSQQISFFTSTEGQESQPNAFAM